MGGKSSNKCPENHVGTYKSCDNSYIVQLLFQTTCSSYLSDNEEAARVNAVCRYEAAYMRLPSRKGPIARSPVWKTKQNKTITYWD